eukprot:8296335-Pyramimonas_sp.AAC.1
MRERGVISRDTRLEESITPGIIEMAALRQIARVMVPYCYDMRRGVEVHSASRVSGLASFRQSVRRTDARTTTL